APSTVNPKGLPLKGFQQKAKTPYSQGYNLSLQYQINSQLALSAAYVGSLARHIEVNLDPNAVGELLPTGTTTASYVPYQTTALSGNNVTMTAASSSYNSFQVNLEERAAHGLTFLTNFAWQKTLTNARDPLEGDIGAYRAAFVPGFGIGRDLARADFDVRRIFHFSGTYNLPYGNGRAFGSNARGLQQVILGGWSTNFVATVQDGQPFTVGCAVATGAGTGCNANLVPGSNPYAHSSVAHFLSAAAFSTPSAVTTIGQTDFAPLGGGPTQVSGPPFRRIDLSLFKQFHFTEQFYAEFRTEVFNITNTPNFANPTALNYINTTNFGQLTATRDSPNDPREIQFALKVYW
ncbi:MAG TPA: TonB-dependent receptor, partial [Edaphobacter sp.]|nr:TonB-dependent receptor [Edaphobacter sp.]